MFFSVFQELKKTSPTNKKVCSCAMDIESNGVLEMLRHSALKLREPKLMYGMYEKIGDGFAQIGYQEDANLYNFEFGVEFDAKMRNKRKAFPKLDSSAHWKVWKNASEQHVMHDYKEAALFLYCVLE